MTGFTPVTSLRRSPSQTAGTEACKISSSGKNMRAFCKAQAQGNRSLQALQSSTRPSWPLGRDCEGAVSLTTRALPLPGSTARSRATQQRTGMPGSLSSRHTRQAPSMRRSTPSPTSASQESASLSPETGSSGPAANLMNSSRRMPHHREPVLAPTTHPAFQKHLLPNVVESTKRKRSIKAGNRIPLLLLAPCPTQPSLPLRHGQAAQSSLSTTCRLTNTTSASR